MNRFELVYTVPGTAQSTIPTPFEKLQAITNKMVIYTQTVEES